MSQPLQIITRNMNVMDGVSPPLHTHFPNVTAIKFALYRETSGPDDALFEKLIYSEARHFTGLTRLDLTSAKPMNGDRLLTYYALAPLQKLPHLRDLSVHQFDCNEALVADLARLSQLTSLSLYELYEEQGLHQTALRSLEELGRFLHGFPGLVSLDINFDAHISHITRLTTLTCLRLEVWNLFDEDCAAFSQLPSVRVLLCDALVFHADRTAVGFGPAVTCVTCIECLSSRGSSRI